MGLFDRFAKWFQTPTWHDEALRDLNESLLLADAGSATTDSIVRHVEKHYPKNTPITKEELVRQLKNWFTQHHQPRELRMTPPAIFLVVGVNGVGKTTFIAKLANVLMQQGNSVSLIAGDTFRAGAVEQLSIWATRLGIPCYQGDDNADPASVIFEGLKQASSDVVLIDTAGRLQNKTHLMNELAKVKRVIQKLTPDAPQETLLVLDATTGQNGLQQARVFTDSIGVSGVVLNKWDGVAKGGFLLSIVHQLSLPIFYLGVGEGLDDLTVFDADSFLQRLGESS